MKHNKIFILSIIVSLSTFFIFLTVATKYGVMTGFSTSDDNATVNITIGAAASITFLDSICNFGSGAVAEEPEFAIVYSNGTVINSTNDTFQTGDWSGCLDGLNLTNNGNVDINLTLTSTSSALEFIGGNSNRQFQWKATNDSLCTFSGEIDDYTEIAANTPAIACNNLTLDGTVKIDFKLQIPEDSTPGNKGTVITATGTSI